MRKCVSKAKAEAKTQRLLFNNNITMFFPFNHSFWILVVDDEVMWTRVICLS